MQNEEKRVKLFFSGTDEEGELRIYLPPNQSISLGRGEITRCTNTSISRAQISVFFVCPGEASSGENSEKWALLSENRGWVVLSNCHTTPIQVYAFKHVPNKWDTSFKIENKDTKFSESRILQKAESTLLELGDAFSLGENETIFYLEPKFKTLDSSVVYGAKLECKTQGHNKFWHVTVVGTHSKVWFGKIGTVGVTQEKDHKTIRDCIKKCQELVKSKLRKGYKQLRRVEGDPADVMAVSAEEFTCADEDDGVSQKDDESSIIRDNSRNKEDHSHLDKTKTIVMDSDEEITPGGEEYISSGKSFSILDQIEGSKLFSTKCVPESELVKISGRNYWAMYSNGPTIKLLTGHVDKNSKIEIVHEEYRSYLGPEIALSDKRNMLAVKKGEGYVDYTEYKKIVKKEEPEKVASCPGKEVNANKKREGKKEEDEEEEAVKDRAADDISISGDAFQGMTLTICGRLSSMEMKDFVDSVAKFGGNCTRTFKKGVTTHAIVPSSKDHVDSKKLQEMRLFKIPEIQESDLLVMFIKDNENTNHKPMKPKNGRDREKDEAAEDSGRSKRRKKDDTSREQAMSSKSKNVDEKMEESDGDDSAKSSFINFEFCITGTLSMVRRKFIDLIISNGGKVVDKVYPSTTHLILGHRGEGTTKYDAAVKRKIPIVDEDWVIKSLRINLDKEEQKDDKMSDDDHGDDRELREDADDESKKELEDGEKIEGIGSGKNYYIKRTGIDYYCSCPSWRNQSMPVNKRTCKHLIEFRGYEKEKERVGASNMIPVRKRDATTGSSTSSDTANLQLLLAQKFELSKHDPVGWYISEKLDGVRAYWTGREGDSKPYPPNKMLSRLGNTFDVPTWFTENFPDYPLDGELFLGRGKFQDCVSIVKTHGGGDRWKGIVYHVFDAPTLAGDFEKRLEVIKKIETTCGYIAVVEHEICKSSNHLMEKLQWIEEKGGEGLMLRDPKSVYERRRSATLLKVKTFEDAEATVIGYIDGKGRHKGRMGALEVETSKGLRFNVGTGFTDLQRETPPSIGSIITYRYQELTKDGKPRFPVFVRERPTMDT